MPALHDSSSPAPGALAFPLELGHHFELYKNTRSPSRPPWIPCAGVAFCPFVNALTGCNHHGLKRVYS